jgi:ribosome biogenesis GTPase
MSNPAYQASFSLPALGWSVFFEDQVMADEAQLDPMRVASVHRTRMTAFSTSGQVRLDMPHKASTAEYAVGDWVLVEANALSCVRRLDRTSVLQRRTEGARKPQLIAANMNTLFVVTSCNDDLNPARLERYLALANQAGAEPVVVLTKADQVADVEPYRQQVIGLQRDLQVVALNATSPNAALMLAPWLTAGQTIALVGSSGVGKSSLLNMLSAKPLEQAQPTGAIREGDAKGRHTTTSRSLHPIVGGAWVIDTPGMRSLHVSDSSAGLEQLFSEITELAPNCRFRDCTHAHEPGCAVQAAVMTGALDPARLERWRKLDDENRASTPVLTGQHGKKIPKYTGKRR